MHILNFFDNLFSFCSTCDGFLLTVLLQVGTKVNLRQPQVGKTEKLAFLPDLFVIFAAARPGCDRRDASLCGACTRPIDERSLVRGGGGEQRLWEGRDGTVKVEILLSSSLRRFAEQHWLGWGFKSSKHVCTRSLDSAS